MWNRTLTSKQGLLLCRIGVIVSFYILWQLQSIIMLIFIKSPYCFMSDWDTGESFYKYELNKRLLTESPKLLWCKRNKALTTGKSSLYSLITFSVVAVTLFQNITQGLFFCLSWSLILVDGRFLLLAVRWRCVCVHFSRPSRWTSPPACTSFSILQRSVFFISSQHYVDRDTVLCLVPDSTLPFVIWCIGLVLAKIQTLLSLRVVYHSNQSIFLLPRPLGESSAPYGPPTGRLFT